MKRNVAVIVPIQDPANALKCMAGISRNSILPDRVVIINNCGFKIGINLPPAIHAIALDQAEPIGRNAAWKLGFKLTTDADMIAVLQENIALSGDFFAKLRHASNMFPTASVFCPHIIDHSMVSDSGQSPDTSTEAPVGRHMEKIDGRAFVIRGEYLRKMPAIPPVLTTYFGADWIWFWTRRVWNKQWIRIENALANENPGDTVHSMEVNNLLLTEMKLFKSLLADL